jgi:hypothetical protein
MRSYLTIVSGMPRSGTSLMMRMHEAGGITSLTDGRRSADEHNPHGYFEDERVMRLARDSDWLDDVQRRGEAVKIIYRLLPNLPPHLTYRVVFMERNIEEVYDSQQDMLASRHDPAADQDRERIIRALSLDVEKIKQWIAKQSNFRCLFVSYAELITDPDPWIDQIAEFLGGVDERAMKAAIDPSLYRHHSR